LKSAGRVIISRFFHVTASSPESCNTSLKKDYPVQGNGLLDARNVIVKENLWHRPLRHIIRRDGLRVMAVSEEDTETRHGD
jgi:hypothetical protein